MPKNLVDDPTSFPKQTAPTAGEPRTAGSVETPFQQAANRAAYLKRRLDHVQKDGEGIRRLRSIASIAALKDATDRPDGTVMEVAGVGLYRFDAASVAEELSPLVLCPTDVTHPAPGRWHVVGYGLLDAPNGIPTLNDTGRLPTSRLAAADIGGRIFASAVRNGIVHARVVRSTAEVAAANTYTDVPGASFTVALEVDDYVIADFNADTESMDEENIGQFRILMEQPDTTLVDLLNGKRINNVSFLSAAVRGAGVVTQAGNHTIKFQVRTGSGTGPVTVRDVLGTLLVVRP